MKIVRVMGKEIYDSRGWPTILCEVWLENGAKFTGYAPAGLAPSRYEAREMRDGGTRLWGKGVHKAIQIIEEIVEPMLIGKEPNAPDLDLILLELDGTTDKSHLGSNTMVAISMALYKAYASNEQVELYELFAYVMGADSVMLPSPQVNVISGGNQGSGSLLFQEFMLAPIGASSLSHGIEMCAGISHELKNVLRKHNNYAGISDEGAYITNYNDDHAVLDVILESIEHVSFEQAGFCALALDASATRFYDLTAKKYVSGDKIYSSEEMVLYYQELIQKYPIYSIEDALSEDDWEGWEFLMKTIGDKVQIVGDEIFSTNPERILYATQDAVASAVIIKPNQIGTITEALQVMDICRKSNLATIVSNRSGETYDSFIADFAVGTSAGQIKVGGFSRSDRLEKYNRLIAIEQALTSGNDHS